MEPTYSFTIPSLQDETTLDCRIYQPQSSLPPSSSKTSGLPHVRGAVVAHPYAPLGGCFHDPIVLAVAESLFKQGYVVGTFNFRGASGSHGSTSWSGNGEKADYASFAGFLAFYLHYLNDEDGANSIDSRISSERTNHDEIASTNSCPARMMLAGYSYGSLILSRLPPMSTIIQDLDTASLGTNAAEIVLRARRLAEESKHLLHEAQSLRLSRGRQLQPDDAKSVSPTKQHMRPSPVTMGGDESDPSERRRSRDSRDSVRSFDLVRKTVDVPHRIKEHMRHHSGKDSVPKHDRHSSEKAMPSTLAAGRSMPAFQVQYLLISPVLPPLAHVLVPPSSLSTFFGRHSSAPDLTTGFGALQCPTLLIWGTNDNFTSSKRLKTWAQKLAKQARTSVDWFEIEAAGHFWREKGVLKELLQRITDWSKSHDQ